MSDEPEKKKTNRTRPANSGRRKTKLFKKRTLSLSQEVNDLIDSLPEKPKGYRTLWVENAILQHEVKHQIILETAEALNRLNPFHSLTSTLNSYNDSLTDVEVLDLLRQFNGK